MGKPTGFMEYTRVEDPERCPEKRIQDYDALREALPPEQRTCQAARCMNCGVPYCQSDYGCPLHNLIPEWNDLLTRGATEQAAQRLLKTASFPEFTGRVCPALCEKACMLAGEGAVSTRDNELYLIEEAFRQGWLQPRIPALRTEKRVAVVGSGPAGLAVADWLNRRGHRVTVMERSDRAGGLLQYGIPNMKLPKQVVARRLALMEREGVTFLLGAHADRESLSGFDAVALCCGAGQARRLNVEGEAAQGVHFAVEYLTEATKALLEDRPAAISAKDRDVVIVGGGDTGNDCAGTCLRQGCRSLVQLELLPAPPVKRAAGNPWPQWPRVLRTDYGQEEAQAVFGSDPRQFETTVCKVLADEENRVCGVQVASTVRDENGRFVPKAGTERELPCGLLLVAAGFTGCEAETARQFQAPLSARGNVDTAAGSHQLSPGWFAAGDMRTGQSLVVRAIADGRAAAREIDQYLMGYTE